MLGRTIAFVACVFIFVAVAVPAVNKLDTTAPVPGEPVAAAGSGATLARAETSWSSPDHTLDRQTDGHFYASAIIDGAPVRMVVDTGASVVALTAADASAAGLDWNDADVAVIGQGASGEVYGVPARLEEVEIGGIVRRNVDAVIIPEGLGISLLGQSWLKQLDGVEISGDRMILLGG